MNAKKQTTDHGPEFNQDAEPRLRIDVEQDLRTVRVEVSDWRQEPYAQWTEDKARRRVLRIEPLTVDQVIGLEDALRDARLRYTAGIPDQVRDAAGVGGGR